MRHPKPILFSLVVMTGLYFCAVCPKAHGQALPPPARFASGARASDGKFYPADFGTITGVSDAAFQACATAANKVGGGTVVVTGNPILTQTVTTINCNIEFASRDASIQFYPARGSGIPLWIIQGETGRAMTVRGFNASGDGGTQIGVNGATGDGIVVQGGPVYFYDCTLGRFKDSFDVSNTGGHVYWQNCDVTGYVGIRFENNNGDYKLLDSRVFGLLTGISYGDAGLTIDARRCHFGYGPFAVAQFSQVGNSSSGMGDSIFDHCAFEAVGNEAIYTDYARKVQTTKGYLTTCDLTMVGCAITFLPLYQIPAYPHDYAMEFDGPASEINLDFGINAPPKGALGTIYFGHPAANPSSIVLKWRGATSAAVSVPPSQPMPIALSAIGTM